MPRGFAVRYLCGVFLVLVAGLTLWLDPPRTLAQAAKKEPAPPVPPEALLRSDAWKGVPSTPLLPGEIDRLIEKELQASKLKGSPATNDEQFLRRVRLDLTGQLPSADEVEQFLADTDPSKRAKLIERLIDSDEYARHWARYWRHVVSAVEAPFGNAHEPAFEDWLFRQFKENKNWGEIVRAKLTAEGSLKKGDKDANGAIFFLGRHNGADGDIDRAAETSRIFLGIQIQCAQCHNDRRTKIWKQVQFHELAGFFSRMAIGGSTNEFIKVSAKKGGEHRMPAKDSKQVIITYPRFLDGKSPEANADDQARRKALADFLTAEDNYWFSAAYVNRMWTEMVGQGFYERMDDLSPKSDVVYPGVLTRLAAAFRGSHYDTKALVRAIANSHTYQRQVRLGEALNQHMKFAAVYPARLRGEVLWKDLDCVLGRMPENPLLRKAFLGEFDFDPSLKSDEVQGSIAQALWLLNNPLVNDRIKVQDLRVPVPNKGGKGSTPGNAEPTFLKKLLAKYQDDDSGALRALYQHTMSRRPSDRELQMCLQFIQDTRKEMGTRNEAFEDIFRGLINTAEFQRRR